MIRLLARIIRALTHQNPPRHLDTHIRAAHINDQLAEDIAWSIRGNENGLSG